MNINNDVKTLKALLGNYPNTLALKQGRVRDPHLAFEFADVETPHNAFKRVVRDLEFDVAELAIATFLTAKAHGKPLVLLPVAVRGKFHHESIMCRAGEALTPAALAGRRVGIRSYSVTTVTWVRGILQNEYGLDLDRVQWVTFEDAHVAEVREPASCVRAAAGKDMASMLLAGELDAAVLAETYLHDPRFQFVISNPEAAAKEWYQRHRAIPVNHMVVMRQSLLEASPELAQRVFRLLVDAKNADPATVRTKDGMDPFPLGVDAMRNSLELIVQYAAQQGIVPRQYAVDELFSDVTRVLVS
ncbi:MAG: phosphate ABC transporter substrate-binding protein [Burkholderiales bacterium]